MCGSARLVKLLKMKSILWRMSSRAGSRVVFCVIRGVGVDTRSSGKCSLVADIVRGSWDC